MHLLVVGNANTGKSWLARSLASKHTGRVLVFDPTKARGWPANAVKWADPGIFLAEIEMAQSAHVYVDEAADLWTFDEVRANRLLYRGRHRGLLFVLIAQRTRMVPPNARNQCSRIYAFRQQLDDAKTLAAEYHAELLKSTRLPPKVCIASDGFSATEMRLNFDSLPPKIVVVPGKSVDDEIEALYRARTPR